MTKDLNWADVLDKEFDYVVLTKGNRLQVIGRPSRRQLRRRGRRGWSLRAAFYATDENNGHGTVPPGLQDDVLQALGMLASRVHAEQEKPRGKKKRRARA